MNHIVEVDHQDGTLVFHCGISLQGEYNHS
jgi:hypothetical protein